MEDSEHRRNWTLDVELTCWPIPHHMAKWQAIAVNKVAVDLKSSRNLDVLEGLNSVVNRSQALEKSLWEYRCVSKRLRPLGRMESHIDLLFLLLGGCVSR